MIESVVLKRELQTVSMSRWVILNLCNERRPCTCQESEAAVEWCFVNSHIVYIVWYTILYGSWWNIIKQPLHSLGRCKAYGGESYAPRDRWEDNEIRLIEHRTKIHTRYSQPFLTFRHSIKAIVAAYIKLNMITSNAAQIQMYFDLTLIDVSC